MGLSGLTATGAISGLSNTAWASRKGLSKPTVMTRNGRASDRHTGSMGMLSRCAQRRDARKAKVDEMRVARAEISVAHTCRLTKPKVGPDLSHVDEQVDKGAVHENVAEQNDKDVGGVSVLAVSCEHKRVLSVPKKPDSPWLGCKIWKQMPFQHMRTT